LSHFADIPNINSIKGALCLAGFNHRIRRIFFYLILIEPIRNSLDAEEIYMAKPKPKPKAKLKLKKHHINRDWCKGCRICVELCPKKVLELDDQEKVAAVRTQDCICCRLCELRCPDFAIEIETQK
jgi:2-oxoglutarate ferredoxin oxidoreductase subunit delta